MLLDDDAAGTNVDPKGEDPPAVDTWEPNVLLLPLLLPLPNLIVFGGATPLKPFDEKEAYFCVAGGVTVAGVRVSELNVLPEPINVPKLDGPKPPSILLAFKAKSAP